MADVKREVRELGQKITGLKAGDNVTLVLKKPKPKVDATPAKKAAELAGEHLGNAQEAILNLTRARDAATSGDAATAKRAFRDAKQILSTLQRAIPRAKDFLDSAKADHDGSPSEVKNGYGAAKDGAELAVGHMEKVAEGLETAMGAVGAFVEEITSRG